MITAGRKFLQSSLVALCCTAACLASTVANAGDTELKNKEIVVAFYNLIFKDHKIKEAFDRYGGDQYIQHNPMAPNGRAALESFLGPYFKANPNVRMEIKRVIAEGDLVVLHVHSTENDKSPGSAVVDMFRVENGKVVEHWDVIQQIPEKSANQNTMF